MKGLTPMDLMTIFIIICLMVAGGFFFRFIPDPYKWICAAIAFVLVALALAVKLGVPVNL